uniref:Nurim n=2 Tax=Eptatretus burgeri TaxID=7764 RepID=A0A8C4QIG8_EPTBU
MERFRIGFVFVVALCALLSAFSSTWRLILYLSSDCLSHGPVHRQSLTWSKVQWDERVWWPLAVDLGYLALFVLQHSIMACPPVKHLLNGMLGMCQRAVYVICSAATLQIMLNQWQEFPTLPALWSIESSAFQLFCFLLHTVSWLVLLSITLLFDFPELVGMKQMYYQWLGLGEPMTLKSEQARRLYSHVRHPVCLELMLLLWLVPHMSIGRALLAATFTMYVKSRHALDEHDYTYLRSQLARKLDVFAREEAGRGMSGPSEGVTTSE